MTLQISDAVYLDNMKFELVGANGHGLFDPKRHGLLPQRRSTACYNGYWREYRVRDDQLMLDTLCICCADIPPELEGIKPDKLKPSMRYDEVDGERVLRFVHPEELDPTVPAGFDYVYRAVKYHVSYTGGLLITRNYIGDPFEHLCFLPPHEYEEVHEILFVDGAVRRRNDCSAKAAELRRKMSNLPSVFDPKSDPKTQHDIINEIFIMDY